MFSLYIIVTAEMASLLAAPVQTLYFSVYVEKREKMFSLIPVDRQRHMRRGENIPCIKHLLWGSFIEPRLHL